MYLKKDYKIVKRQKTQTAIAMFVTTVFLAAALTSTSTSANLAYGQQQDRLLVHIKSGTPNNYDEVHSARMAMDIATHMQKQGKNVSVFLDVNGVNIGVKNPTFTLNSTATMLKDLIDNGGKVYVCPDCLIQAKYSEGDLMAGVQLANPEIMAKELSGNVIVIDY
jgi:predicted peroxiredoxin